MCSKKNSNDIFLKKRDKIKNIIFQQDFKKNDNIKF